MKHQPVIVVLTALFVTALLAPACLTAWAAPLRFQSDGPLEVVADTGASIPADPYFAHLINGESSNPELVQGIRFPVRSLLKNGVLAKDQLQVFAPSWMATPIFVVGCDAASANWVQLNKARLSDLGAVGVVVDAPDLASFKAMQAQAQAVHLMLSIAQGPWLQERLQRANVDVYPVLIHTNGHAIQRLGELD